MMITKKDLTKRLKVGEKEILQVKITNEKTLYIKYKDKKLGTVSRILKFKEPVKYKEKDFVSDIQIGIFPEPEMRALYKEDRITEIDNGKNDEEPRNCSDDYEDYKNEEVNQLKR